MNNQKTALNEIYPFLKNVGILIITLILDKNILEQI